MAEAALVVLSGGVVRAEGAAAPRRVAEAIAKLIKVRSFCCLVGAGASYHIGLPRIREMAFADLEALTTRTGAVVSADARDLLAALVGEKRVDLEGLLAQLQVSLAFCQRMGLDALPIGEKKIGASTFASLRESLNKALATDCDWLRHRSNLQEPLKSDPLRGHREFIRRLVTARGIDLPRVRVFTTNYDLLLESALDELRFPYSDGFVGTVSRWLQLETFDRDLYELQPGRRPQRVADMLYLYKLHGSINWTSDPSAELATTEIHQSPGVSDRAVIFPTPQKDWDVLGYPYSDLLRAFSAHIMQPEAALIVVGYGFGDDHVNRVMARAIKANTTLQLLVVAPAGVLADEKDKNGQRTFSASRLGSLAQIGSPRITVVSGADATFERFAIDLLPDPERDATEAEREEGLAEAVDAALGTSSAAPKTTEPKPSPAVAQ